MKWLQQYSKNRTSSFQLWARSHPSDLKDKSWHIYANFCFSSHPFGKILVSFLQWKHMSASPLPLSLRSCFLARLLVNLKLFYPFAQNWHLHKDAQLMRAKEGRCSSHFSRHFRIWKSSEQILQPLEGPFFRWLTAIYTWNTPFSVSKYSYSRIFFTSTPLTKQRCEKTWRSSVSLLLR